MESENAEKGVDSLVLQWHGSHFFPVCITATEAVFHATMVTVTKPYYY